MEGQMFPSYRKRMDDRHRGDLITIAFYSVISAGVVVTQPSLVVDGYNQVISKTVAWQDNDGRYEITAYQFEMRFADGRIEQ